MGRKKQPNPKRIKGKGEAWAYSKQKWIPGKGRKLKKMRKRNIRDLSLNPTLKEQFEADQKENDEWLAKFRYTKGMPIMRAKSGCDRIPKTIQI